MDNKSIDYDKLFECARARTHFTEDAIETLQKIRDEHNSDDSYFNVRTWSDLNWAIDILKRNLKEDCKQMDFYFDRLQTGE